MKSLLLIFSFSLCVAAQTDPCVKKMDASGSNTIRVIPDDEHSLEPIRVALKQAASSKFPNVVIDVVSGIYDGPEGISIRESEIKGKQVCLNGVGRPTVARTVNKGRSPVIFIDGVSNLTIQGLNIEGVFTEDKTDIPLGLGIDHSSENEISNITIKDNWIHGIGHTYKQCSEKVKVGKDENKLSCGDSHGIYINSTGGKIAGVSIGNNRFYNLRLGTSEALTISNNVTDFTVTDNTFDDIDNIAIDIAGMQEKEANFQVTKGLIERHHVKNIVFQPYRNPASPFVAGNRPGLVESDNY